MKAGEAFKKVVFLNCLSDVDEYISNKKDAARSGADELCIAMTPGSCSLLKQRGIKARNTVEYFTNNSHMKVLEKSKILVDWLLKSSDFVDMDLGIKESLRDSFIPWMRCAIHYCLWTIEVVSNARDKHKPGVLSAPYSGRRTVSSLLIEPEEKYLGDIVNAIAGAKKLKYDDISGKKAGNGGLFILRLFDRASTVFKFMVRSRKFRSWTKTVFAKCAALKKRPFFFTATRNMAAIISELQNKTMDTSCFFVKNPAIAVFDIPDFILKTFYRAHSAGLLEQKRMLRKLQDKIKKETQLFSYKGISFAGIVSQKIQDGIANYMVGLILWAIRLDDFIDKSKAKGFICDGHRADDMILAGLCKKKGIPDILISHGSLVRPKNMHEAIEWSEQGRVLMNGPFSHLALQSPLSEGYLDVFPSAAGVIKTGPIVWGKSVNSEISRMLFERRWGKKNDFEKTKVVLHAGTAKAGKAFRFYVYESPDEYFQSIRELAKAVEKIPNTMLIVRFRPQVEISVNDAKKSIPFSDKVVLSVDEPFNDVLGTSDLLVSFSSTTIEEALQNKIPVLLYGCGGRYQHIPAYAIKPGGPIEPDAAYHLREARDLECAIKGILDLNIREDKWGHLFERYIYPQNARASLVDLLKAEFKKQMINT